MLFLRSIAIFLYATSIIAAPEQSPEEPRGGEQPRRRLGFYSDFFSKDFPFKKNFNNERRIHSHNMESNILLANRSSISEEPDITNSSASEYTIESMNISASKVALDNVLHLIKYRFNLDNKYRAQVFSVAANLNNNAWDIMKVL